MAETTPLHGSDAAPVRVVGGCLDWATTLAEHDRWLRTAVLARLGERQAVEEVMQEVALAAVAQRAPLQDRSRVGAWLYRVAVRQVLLYRRRRGRQRKLWNNYVEVRGNDHREPVAADALDWLLRDERKMQVRAALSRLPARDAEILLLKYTEDWSYRELAERLGVSESAVEARLHRARGRLREAIIRTDTNEVQE